MAGYDHKAVEQKWQNKWRESKAFETPDNPGSKKMYVLDMFPYPSGAGIHLGHTENYTATDIYSRFKRMQGYEVLHPIGWDAFGLPAENYAIKTGVPPQKTTDDAIDNFRRQIQELGFSYDWSRELGTHDPEYYRWTQWFFLFLYKNGLAEKRMAKVNWCPKDQTVLANEQVVEGKCERCGTEVIQKDLEQWFFKITEFADVLVDDLDQVDWPESTKINQRNWIGRSEGAEIDFQLNLPTKTCKVVVIHGFEGSPESNWMPWFKAELEKRGYDVRVPAWPNPKHPNFEEAMDFLRKEVSDLGPQDMLIGHSLGGHFALKLAEEKEFGRIILVAPAVGDMPFEEWYKDPEGQDIEALDNAIRKHPVEYSKIKTNLKMAFFGEDDPDVPPRCAAALDSSWIVRIVSNQQHYTQKNHTVLLSAIEPRISVFTTRPDTLFGATYLVLAPEHPWVKLALQHKTVLQNNDEVVAYVEKANKKTELERTENKEKTGVELKGVKAINSATKEEIPMFVADYVLGNYGTGAIMAVPAHDERDHEFAKKFNLPIKRVIEPKFYGSTGEGAVREGMPFVERNAVCAVVRNPKDDTYLCNVWKGIEMRGILTGGIDEGEDPAQAAMREIREESGYKNVKLVSDPDWAINTYFYHRQKKENRHAHFRILFFDLVDDERDPVDEAELSKHEFVWKKKDELKNFFTVFEGDFVATLLANPDHIHTGAGILTNSGEFDGKESEEAKKLITEHVGGRVSKQYHLRDWLISRQRYWGAPIPVVYDPNGKSHPVPEEHLPWLLPTDVEFKPTGVSPLGQSKELLERTEKIFGKGWKPEIDTMDTFVCSSWYFFRFTDPHNTAEFANKDAIQKWLPVDLYMGGAEHTVLHLMYARFLTKALQKFGYVNFSEPFLKLRHQGLILAEDGNKMSKSKGNVVNPDDLVGEWGADTLRMYMMFMGPLEAQKPWSSKNIVGIRRFLDRVWRIKASDNKSPLSAELEKVINQTIKKVGEDIETLKLNTAISSLMILLNEFEKSGEVSLDTYKIFLQLLAPFAPHIAHELAENAGFERKEWERWPAFDPTKLASATVTVSVQINGKVRGTVELSADASEEEAAAAGRGVVAKWLGAGEEKLIYKAGKVINFVV